jgi:gliding motility-associated-like protein
MNERFSNLGKWILTLILGCFSLGVTHAADWYVNNTMDGTEIWCTAVGSNSNPGTKAAPFATLTYALTQAGNNDRIFVDAGNYYRTDENITATQSGLSIIGAGSLNTIFDDGMAGGTTGRSFIKLRANDITLKDFYIKRYSLRGTIGEAIDISGAAYTGIQILSVKVDNNGNDTGSTFPIEIKDGAQVVFRNGGGTCNKALSLGGGIQVSGASTKVDFYEYLFVGNDRYDHGGALRVNSGTVNVYNSLFSLNNVDSYTGCAFYQGGGTLNLYDCVIESNTASIVSSEPGGVIKIAGGACKITRSKIQNNSSSGYYGTIGVLGGTLEIDSTYFNGNTASRSKDIYAKGGTTTIRNCTFASTGNVIAGAAGTVTIYDSGDPTINGSYSTGVTKSNTNNPTYTANPTVPSFGGNCSTGLKICNPAVAGAGPTAACDGLASLSATAPSGSVFSWYAASSGGLALDTTSTSTTYDLTGVAATTTYYVVSNLDECQTRTPVTVTYDCPACTTTITYPSTPYCQTGTATPTVNDASTGTYTCTVSSTGTLTDLVINSSTGVVDLATSKPGTYTVQLAVTGQPTCNPTTTITIEDSSVPTGSATQTFCSADNKTVADLVATGNNIKWYSASSGGVALNSTDILTTGHYYATQTNGSCESSSRLDVTVTINDNSTPTGSASQSFCSSDNKTVADLVATGNNIKWYSASSGGSALLTTDALTNGHYYATQTNGSCESTTRLDVTVTINDNSTPTGSANQSFCSSDNKTVADLVATGNNIKWYSASSGGSSLPTTDVLTSGHYYATQTNGSCESPSRFDVTVTINDNSTPTGSAAQSFCSSDNKTVADLVATGNNIKWYSASSGGSSLPTTDVLTSGHYYATQTNGTCESTTRFDVTVTINDNSTPTGSAAQSFCSSDNKTVADLVATGNNIKWYSASSGGTALPTTDVLTSGHYYATQTNGTCESPSRFDVTVTVYNNSITATEKTKASCSVADGSVTVIGSGTGNVSWTGTAIGSVNGVSLNYDITSLAAGSYNITFDNGTCIATTSVNLSNLGAPAAPSKITSSGATTFCQGGSITLTASTIPVGATINWTKDGAAFGNPNDNPITVTAGGTYAVSITVAGCNSPSNDTIVTVTTLPNAPTTTNATPEFCSGDNAKISDLNPSGASIKWYNQAVGGAEYSDLTTLLVSGTDYYASQTTSGCESSLRTKVTPTIHTNPTASWTSQPGATSCQGTQIIYNTQLGMVNYVWSFPGVLNTDYKIISGGIGSTNHIVEVEWLTAGSKTVTVSYSEDFGAKTCNTSNTLTNTTDVKTLPVPTFTVSVPATYCTNTDLKYRTEAGFSNYTWTFPGQVLNTDYKIIAGASSNTITIQWLTSGSKSVSVAYADPASSCMSTNNPTATTTINSSPSTPTIGSTVEFCSSDSPTLDMASLKLNGTLIKWYNASDVAVQGSTSVVDQDVYYATQTVGGCESNSKLPVTITVNASPGTPSGNPTADVCKIDNPTVADLTPTSSNNITINWYFNGALQNYTDVLATGTYTAIAENNGCESAQSLTVAVTVNDPQPPADPTTHLCVNNSPAPMLYDIYQNSASILYYATAISNTALTNKTIAKGETYYVRTSSGGCLSTSKPITVPLFDGPSLSNSPYVLTPVMCEKDKPTFDDAEAKYSSLPTSSGTIYWYLGQNDNLSSNLPKSTQIATGSYWIALKDASGCYSSKQQVTLTVDAGTKADLKPIELCSTSSYTVEDLNVADASSPAGILTWYFDNNGVHKADNTLKLLNNIDYWATYKKDANTVCESSVLTKVSITWVDFTEKLTLDNNNQKFCKSKVSYVSDLNYNPYSSYQIGWLEDELSTSPLPNNTELNEMTYFAAEYKLTSDGKYCISNNKDQVDVRFYTPKIYPTTKGATCTKKNGSIEFINPPIGYTFDWYQLPDSSIYVESGSKYSKPIESESFKIVIKDASGCMDSIFVSMPDCSDSPIPQILTPGKEDGNNDKWVINYASKYKEVQVKIFNRWGGEVYSSPIPYTDDWDGKSMSGGYLPTGTYYYVIDKGNGEPVDSGFIELVK